MTDTSLTITESANPLTSNIDVAGPTEIVRLLRQCDAQVFTGYLGYPAILDDEVLEEAARVAWRLSRVLLAGESGCVLISGAGTSGRLAVFLAREFNRQLRSFRMPEVFEACIAGGERAIIAPVEAAEDRSAPGIEDARKAVHADVTSGLYIGITAGLSAPYVAAQLNHFRTLPAWKSVLVGFNPMSQVRASRAEVDSLSMAEVIAGWGDDDRLDTLTPVYGPEVIRGSTRMKGATCTKLLLETIFQLALQAAGIDDEAGKIEPGPDGSLRPLRAALLECYMRYRTVFDAAYHDVPALSALVRLAGNALKSMGRIYYIGRGTAGMMCVMDASECPPTFGADPFDVRAFIQEGWAAWLGEDRDLTNLGRGYAISFEDFESEFLPEVGRGDLVIGCVISTPTDSVLELLEEAATRRCRTALVVVSPLAPKLDELPKALDLVCHVDVPSLGFRPGYFNEAEIALKLVLNAITTGGHILSGKVYGNTMIDLRLSNTKLYARALSTLQTLAGVDEATAKLALHRAVFDTDDLPKEQADAPPMDVVRAAGDRRGIVPRALLIATKRFTVAQATRMLAEDPFVRRVVEGAITQSDA